MFTSDLSRASSRSNGRISFLVLDFLQKRNNTGFPVGGIYIMRTYRI
jgi:hypothetical protein